MVAHTWSSSARRWRQKEHKSQACYLMGLFLKEARKAALEECELAWGQKGLGLVCLCCELE